MNISINWLKKYVDLSGISPEEIANKLTMSTVEVEAVDPVASQLENVFVGKINKIMPHPNADKLKLADIDLGTEKVRVVCGGSNLEVNMLIALAKPGAKIVWHGEGDPVKLEPTEIRGEKSFGMVCAANEIGLGNMYSHDYGEILDLTRDNLEIGKPLAEALGLSDFVIDIDNKSLTNRPDLWSHYGIARELAALYGKDFKEIKFKKGKEGKGIDLKLKVKDQKLCPAYFAIAVSDIKIGPSPKWLKQALQSIGQKSINNIVDITNYILFELGQPLHAFDSSKLKNGQIVVRRANPGEKLTTIDGETQKLSEQMLVIADNEKPVALAGIMGGQNSEITEKSTSIIIESANFDAVNIRRTSMGLGIRTESSMRFEKALDPNNAMRGLERAVELIQDVIPEAKISSDIVEHKKFKLDQGPITLPKDFLEQRIGQKIEDKKVEKILENLGFKVKDKRKEWEVTVPTFRATGDVSIKEDLIEEVSRIVGYDNIDAQMPEVKNKMFDPNKERDYERQVKKLLSLAFGSTEVKNYSFTNPNLLEKFDMDFSNHWQLENPWDENENLMRQNLWPSLVVNVKDNLRFYDNVNIFELGRVFLQKDSENNAEPKSDHFVPAQPYYLAGAFCSKNVEVPFYEVKQIVEKILQHFEIEFSFSKQSEKYSFQHPQRCAFIKIKNKEIGWICELNPLIGKDFEIDHKVALWQLNFSELVELIEEKYEYEPINKYPAVVHDISLIIDEKTMFNDIFQIIKTVNPKIIKKIDLIDVFKNGKIKKGKKSITLRITYQSDQGTLEKEEVEKLQNKVVTQLGKGLGAALRQ